MALAFLPPGAVLLAPAALVLVGGLGFVCASAVRAMVPAPDAGDAAFAVPSLLGDRAFVAVLVPALVAGGVSGALSVAVPVVLQGDGGPAAAGIALGLFAGGSAVGGLLFGALRVPGGAVRQLVLLSGARKKLGDAILGAGAKFPAARRKAEDALRELGYPIKRRGLFGLTREVDTSE